MNEDYIPDNQSNQNDIDNDEIKNNGRIKTDNSTIAVLPKNSTLFTILGWVSAGLAAFYSPIFAVAGIVFGILLNRQVKNSGNYIIITNIVVAAINILFGLILIMFAYKLIFG